MAEAWCSCGQAKEEGILRHDTKRNEIHVTLELARGLSALLVSTERTGRYGSRYVVDGEEEAVVIAVSLSAYKRSE